MRRFFIMALVVVLVVFSICYILIPDILIIEKRVQIDTPEEAVFKYVLHPNTWPAWWPKAASSFKVKKATIASIDCRFVSRGEDYRSLISYSMQRRNNVMLTIILQMPRTTNPFNKIGAYFKAKKLAREIGSVLYEAKNFLEDDLHVYGIRVRQAKVLLPFMLTSKEITNVPLSAEDVSKRLERLRDYSRLHDVAVIGNPMLNITQIERGKFSNMVAIPVERKIGNSENIYLKQMPYKGNMLTVDVKGGPRTISNATEQLINYMRDNNYTSPGAPFEEMINNRAQTDTAQWITKIWYPVL